MSGVSASMVLTQVLCERHKLAYVRCLRTTPPASDISGTSPGWTFSTLDAGHWPMITHPEATARVIEELGRQ